MTFEEFLERLAATRETIAWHLEGHLVRGDIEVDGHRVSVCPITALADPPRLAAHWQEVFHDLGMELGTAVRIVEAADCVHPLGALIRPKILVAVGLTDIPDLPEDISVQ